VDRLPVIERRRWHDAIVPALIDSHSHIDAAEFDGDRGEAIARARTAGVAMQVVPAVDVAAWPGLRDLCAREPGLFPAWGLHPTFLPRHRPEHLHQLRDWLHQHRPVAVGECGLDFWIDGLDRDEQQRYFLAQLRLAREFDLPVIVHARKAFDEVTAALRRIGGLRGVVHSFSGSLEQARALWSLGFHLGIGGPVTYDRARRLRSIVAGMPVEYLLLETDSPDQPLNGHQGARNEPARLVAILEVVAALRGESPGALAAATCANARRLFGLPASASGPWPPVPGPPA
jgi:TatD DNase family protein